MNWPFNLINSVRRSSVNPTQTMFPLLWLRPERWTEERQAVCFLTGAGRRVHRSFKSTAVTTWSPLSAVVVWILEGAPVEGGDMETFIATTQTEESSYPHLQYSSIHVWALSCSPDQIFSQFLQRAVRGDGFWVYPRQQLKYRTTGVKLSTCGHGRGTQHCLSPQQLYRNV